MDSGKGRKILFSFVLSLLVFIVAVGAIELFFHVAESPLSYREWHEKSLTYLLDDDVDWKLEPRSYTWGQVNRNNFRGMEMPVLRTKGVCRIAVVGGSGAFDLNKRDDNTWAAQLESNLSRAMQVRVEVLNAGTPGYSTWQAYRQLKTKVIRWKPDLVLLYELFNDSLYFAHDNRQEIIEGWKRNGSADYIGWLAHPNPLLDFLSACIPRTMDFARMYGVSLQKRRSGADNDRFWKNPRCDWTLQAGGLAFYEENRRNTARFLQQAGPIPLGIVSQASLIRETNTPEETAWILYGLRGMNHQELWKAYRAARTIDNEVAATEPNAFLIDAYSQIPASLDYFVDEVHLNDRGGALLARIIADALLTRRQNPQTDWCKK